MGMSGPQHGGQESLLHYPAGPSWWGVHKVHFPSTKKSSKETRLASAASSSHGLIGPDDRGVYSGRGMRLRRIRMLRSLKFRLPKNL